MFEELYAVCVNPPSLKDWNRFWSKVDLSPGQGPNGTCWQWKGYLERGYGRFGYYKDNKLIKRVLVHRQIMIWINGDISKDFPVDHLKCSNPPCCNYNHLKISTTSENILRDGSRAPAAINKRKQFCKRGHKLTKRNILKNQGNKRKCIKCHRLKPQQFLQKNRKFKICPKPLIK